MSPDTLTSSDLAATEREAGLPAPVTAAIPAAVRHADAQIRAVLPGLLRVSTPDQAHTQAVVQHNSLYRMMSVQLGHDAVWDDASRTWRVELFVGGLTAPVSVGAMVLDENGCLLQAPCEEELFPRVAELQHDAPVTFPPRINAQPLTPRIATREAAAQAMLQAAVRRYAAFADIAIGPVIIQGSWTWVAPLLHTANAEPATIDYIQIDAATGEVKSAPSSTVLRHRGVRYRAEPRA